jgi:deoxyribonucleoside regulator
MMLNIPGSSKSEKLERLIEIARAYYEQGHDQDMIAQSMGISRSQVSRYLTQARESNLVQIRVVSPQDRMGLLEHEISEKFPNLKEAVVVPAFKTSQDILRKTIGRVAAAYFAQLIIPGMNICLGSGRTLREVVYYLRPNQIPNISIIQAMGNVGHEAMQIDFNDIARETARAFSARVIYLNSPAILGSGNVNELVRDNPTINQALQIARAADIFLFGVGSMESDLIFTRNDMIKPNELEQLRARGAVGDICARFFDVQGKEIESDFSARIVGIELTDLLKASNSFCVAGGGDKVLALIGAMKGGFIKTLVTDEQTAQDILEKIIG